MPKYDLKSLFLFQNILALHLQVEIAVIKCPQNSYLREENGMAGYEVTGLKCQFSVWANVIELIICSICTLQVYKWNTGTNRNPQSHLKITWKSSKGNQELAASKFLLQNLTYIWELQVREWLLLFKNYWY